MITFPHDLLPSPLGFFSRFLPMMTCLGRACRKKKQKVRSIQSLLQFLLGGLDPIRPAPHWFVTTSVALFSPCERQRTLRRSYISVIVSICITTMQKMQWGNYCRSVTSRLKERPNLKCLRPSNQQEIPGATHHLDIDRTRFGVQQDWKKEAAHGKSYPTTLIPRLLTHSTTDEHAEEEVYTCHESAGEQLSTLPW